MILHVRHRYQTYQSSLVTLLLLFMAASNCCATAIVVIFSHREAVFAADSLVVERTPSGRHVSTNTVCKISVQSGTVFTLAGSTHSDFYDVRELIERSVGNGLASLLDQIKAFDSEFRPRLAMHLADWKRRNEDSFSTFVHTPDNPMLDALFGKIDQGGELQLFDVKYFADSKGELRNVNCNKELKNMENCQDLVKLIVPPSNVYFYPQSFKGPVKEITEKLRSKGLGLGQIGSGLIDWEISSFPADYAKPISLLYLAKDHADFYGSTGESHSCLEEGHLTPR